MNAPYSISCDYNESESIAKVLLLYMNDHRWMKDEQKANWELLKEVFMIFASPEWLLWKYKRQKKDGKHAKRNVKLRRSEAMIFMEVNDWDRLDEIPYERSVFAKFSECIYVQKLDIVDRDDSLNRNQDFDLESFINERSIKLHWEQ